MLNEEIRAEIKLRMSVECAAKEIGCTPKSLYNKLDGTCPWKMTEILALSRICEWTVERFLEIIEYKEADNGDREF